jgi:HD-GYP domain-containing protein (c-di-GMP phosphodiesterase class II)
MNINLKFDNIMEKEYCDFKYTENLKQTRIVLGLLVIMFGIFSFYDAKLFNDPDGLIIRIKLFMILPVFLLTLFSSFSKWFKDYNHIILSVALIIAGSGFSIMLLQSRGNLGYYGAIFLITYSAYFVLNLRYKYATVIGWVILFFYLFVSISQGSSIDLETFIIFIFIMGSNIIGMMGSYFLEFYSRKNYLQSIKIESDNHNLEERVALQVKEITDQQSATIYALAKLAESRDRDTGVHIERVGKYCKLIAEKIDWTVYSKLDIQKNKFVDTIEMASALHDIGKVGIEDKILLKPGPLTKEEFARIKMHTIIGSDTLITLKKKYPNNVFVNMGLEITRYHHEKFDGSGYPDGLSGLDIPLSARILAIADVYDALTTKRPYKDIFSHSESMEIMIKDTGSHFDPDLMMILKEVEYAFNIISKSNNIIEIRNSTKTKKIPKLMS